MRSIRTAKVAKAAATFESLGTSLSRHRALARVASAALSFTLLVSLHQPAVPASAGPASEPVTPQPLLPQSLGDGIATDAAVSVRFDQSMDPASVGDGLQVIPAQDVRLDWNRSRTVLSIAPSRLWRAGERYLLVVPNRSRTQSGDPLAATRRFTFTTQAPPLITGVEVTLAGDVKPPEEPIAGLSHIFEADPAAEIGGELRALSASDGAALLDPTPTEVSPTSSIVVSFSQLMDADDTLARFRIAPSVIGELSWRGQDLVFAPSERLEPGMRYTINLAGAHDHRGNVLRDGSSVSFVIADRARMTRSSPKADASGVSAPIVQMWFSRPMQVDATNAAFSLTDGSTGRLVGGHLSWNEAATRLTYVPDRPFAGGRTFTVALDESARDVDGNAVSLEWSFTTGAPARATASTRTAPSIPPPAPGTTLGGYALAQVNAARAAYGFAPLVLDASISAVAAAHAWDQARNNYFSHYGLDGSTREVRLARGGVRFGWSGENQCYHLGMSQRATLDWCHAQFMAEPYPGVWNHIANILNPNARRMGIGIATVGDKTVITWDFTD